MLWVYIELMAEETFEKVLVRDDRLQCITDKVRFQVLKGGLNITSQPYRAISQTNSAHAYNVAVPSLETVISREVLWKSTIALKITSTNKPANEFFVNYGVTDALAPFPLHHLVNTMTDTINSNTVSMNAQERLPWKLYRRCRRLLSDNWSNSQS